MTQLAAIPDVAPGAIFTVPTGQVDEFWPQFAPMFRHSSSTLGARELEIAERAALDLARSAIWTLGLVDGMAVSAAAQIFDDGYGVGTRVYNVLPYYGPECSRDDFDRMLLESIEARAKALGCTHIEVRHAWATKAPAKSGYLASLVELQTKDLRGSLS